MTTQDLVNYYSGLLIKQYAGKTKAVATVQLQVTQAILPQTTVQTISFPTIPTSGNWEIEYGSLTTSSLAWNSSAGNIQSALQALTGLGSITVSGSMASGLLTVTFTDVPPVATLLTVTANTLSGSSGAVTPVITETDVTLPLAVQDAFNLLGPNPAVGVQLDVLGKYTGVTRSGFGTGGQPVTLDDTDFLTLIRMAIVTNNADSSLETIQNFLFMFFPNLITVYDYQNMHMSYLIDSSIGSLDLVELMVTEKLLPKPMGVQLSSVIIGTEFFSFCDARVPTFRWGFGFNDVNSYTIDTPWLSVGDAV